ncbi:hypothetical protein [Streptomyces shenzhenensis]|uniref:hypothetical protein n=1 Tax=Streptomyces shenzhenensis TaxID=943815 RepID=UPI0036C01D78
MKREELLAAARRHMWAAWQLSSEELASQAADTLLGLGMLVPEGGARELEVLRARVAELEARAKAVRAVHVKFPDSEHCQHDCEPWPCPTVAALDPVDGITRRFTPTQALREDEAAEAPYVSRSLPPRGAVCARPGCGHTGADHHHGDTKCWAHLPRTRDEFGAWSGTRICLCAGFVSTQEDPHDGPLHHEYRVSRELPDPKAAISAESAVCRCDEPGADPYSCEADDCSGHFSELNPFGSGARPVDVASAEVSRKCGQCGWRTSVWHVDDGSAEAELHEHVVRVHVGDLPETGGAR